MSSNEEKPSVLSSRVFKVRDWNRLEAYRLDTKIQALETEKRCAHTRISFEQREVKKDLVKLRETKQSRKLSLPERRLGFALKRSSSDLAVRIEKCQQAFAGPSSAVAQRRCRADSEPPDVFSLPPVTGERRTGVSTPPSWTERNFNSAQCLAPRGGREEPKTRLILRKHSWSTLAQVGQVERLAESTNESVNSPALSNGSTEEERDKAQTKYPSISTKTRPKPLLQHSYSTNSILTLNTAGKELRYRELTSLYERDQLPCTTVPHRGGQNGCKLTVVPSLRSRQRSYTMPGLSTDGSHVNEKLEPLSSDSASGRSCTTEPLLE